MRTILTLSTVTTLAGLALALTACGSDPPHGEASGSGTPGFGTGTSATDPATCIADDGGAAIASEGVHLLSGGGGCPSGSHPSPSIDGGSPPVGTADGGPVPPPSLCLPGLINNEPEILVGYLPGPGQSVSVNGQIKVWLSDEAPAFISSGEVVDPTTGAITTPGDRTAKAPDGYLWEPALYVTPASGGTTSGAYFPVTIKGWYNNSPPLSYVAGKQVPGIEPFPTPPLVTEIFSTELIWDVGSMGLAPGDYTAEFVVHDGDTDRGVGCVNITIAPAAK